VKRSRTVGDLVKRVADVIASALALVVLSPVFALVSVGVLVTMGSPMIFQQERTGLDGRVFTLYKFRTMREAPAGVTGVDAVASDSERLTGFGRFLRSSSLDELPQLLNVLKGDMSVVGPRPLLPEYLDRYNEQQARRHEVRPGMTGWALVNGRNALSWDERFKLDVWYVDHRSLALDARILAMTVWAVVSRKGISGQGTETMQPFEGDTRSPTTKES
jgi:lipopolysaccharide/colanic/teichoic acid biosynthesis glycosyltransferase